MSESQRPVIVVEDDAFTRIIQVVLDPSTPADRVQAFDDFFWHDEPDFQGWCDAIRRESSSLSPRRRAHGAGRRREMRANLADADVLVVESVSGHGGGHRSGAEAARAAEIGVVMRGIDVEACEARRHRGAHAATQSEYRPARSTPSP